jgi:type IV pilus assembly protein PilP
MASTSAAEKAKPSSKIQSIYDPQGKIDPFEPLFREKQTVALVKSKRKKRTPRTPLEKIDISQLKLVGIILASSGNRALVEESSGKGYVIKKGTYMGTNSGKVVKIEKDKVIVAEEYEDIRGNVTLRNKEIKLPKPPGEL